MPLAFPALELVAFLTFAVLLVLASTIKWWLTPLFHVLDSTIGHIPFVGTLVGHGESYVLGKLNQAISASRSAMTTCLQGVRWSWLQLIQGVRDFSDDVASSWDQLTNHAIPGAMANLSAWVHTQISSVSNELNGLEGTVKSNLSAAENYADTAVSHAVTTVERYADTAVGNAQDFMLSHVHDIYTEVETDIAAASNAVVKYVDVSIANLKSLEDAAVSAARTAAAAALSSARGDLQNAIDGVSSALNSLAQGLEAEIAGVASEAATDLHNATTALQSSIASSEAEAEQVAASALNVATNTVEADISTATNTAAANLQAAATQLQNAIGTVSSIASATAGELTAAEAAAAGEISDVFQQPFDQIRELLDRTDLTKILGVGAGLVLLRAGLEALVSEAGLDDAACRAKNKQICGVDPLEWTALLAGGAFLTGELSLSAVYPVARAAFGDLAELMKLAA